MTPMSSGRSSKKIANTHCNVTLSQCKDSRMSCQEAIGTRIDLGRTKSTMFKSLKFFCHPLKMESEELKATGSCRVQLIACLPIIFEYPG